ncbi:SGNH/GDSL hydrolase family protein [Enterococcus sp. AZ194]|uniref:SGNH/GDSL hydrolase family protein n=1 Tax=Enterococcus sp. AZ194 TaxID=2774629 RepID=UPI003F686243
MFISKKDRIVFVGDSITDSNRNLEMPPAKWASWGDGYVHLINGYTTAFHPEKELMVVNKGISGDRVVDLSKRWQEDVLDLRPDWVVIMIGINDVWRHFDSTFSQDEQVTQEMFTTTYRDLLTKTIPSVKGLILLSAFMVEKNLEDPMRKKVDQYNRLTKQLAEEFSLRFVDVQAYFDEFLKHQSSYVLSSDRVHPSTAGHMLIAKAFIESCSLGGGMADENH